MLSSLPKRLDDKSNSGLEREGRRTIALVWWMMWFVLWSLDLAVLWSTGVVPFRRGGVWVVGGLVKFVDNHFEFCVV